MKRSFLLSRAAGALAFCLLAISSPARSMAATATDERQLKDLLLRQAAAANAHDLHAMDEIFVRVPAGQPDPVSFIARAYQFWGRPAVMEHFRQTFEGVWKFEPDAARIKVTPLATDVAQIYAPTRITVGKSPASAATAPFHMYEVAVRTPAGWRIASIVPVPAN